MQWLRSAARVAAAFLVLASTVIVATAVVDSPRAEAMQGVDVCSPSTPEGCFETVVECDALFPGRATVTVSYVGGDPLASSSSYADGLGGFFTANALPADYSLTDGAWNINAFADTAAGDYLSLQSELWVACGYVCTAGDMDVCESTCDVNGLPVLDDCFVSIVECAPNGHIDIALDLASQGIVAGILGDWQAQITTYRDNMQVDSQTITFPHDNVPPFSIDPLPNGSYRVVMALESLAATASVNGGVSATLECTATECPAGECVFEITSAEIACTGGLQMVIVGSVPVLNADQITDITISVNGVDLPASSVFNVNALDLEPPYPDGDGIRETVSINVFDDSIAEADDYEVIVTVEGSNIYNETFMRTVVQDIDGAGCATVTVDCSAQTVSAQVLLEPSIYDAGWYSIPGAFADSPVTLVIYDANGSIVDWAPQGGDFPDPDTRISNPLVTSFATGAAPFTWQIGHTVDWGFFNADDLGQIDDLADYGIWVVWDQGEIECAPPTISIESAATVCTNVVETNGSIELTATLTNGATITSITLDATSDEITDAPYVWSGLAGGDYTFTVVSDPTYTFADAITVGDCPTPSISFSSQAVCASSEELGSISIEIASNQGVTINGLELAGATPVRVDEPGPFTWSGLGVGSYQPTIVGLDPADATVTGLDAITVADCGQVTAIATTTQCTSYLGDAEIELDVTTTGLATLSSITLVETGVTVTAAPFVWTGLTGGDYTFEVVSDPIARIDPVRIAACPSPKITVGDVVTTCATANDGTITAELGASAGASLDITIAGVTQTVDGAFPTDVVWSDLAAGVYKVQGSATPQDSYSGGMPAEITIEQCTIITVTATVECVDTAVGPATGSLLAEVVVEPAGAVDFTAVRINQTGAEIASPGPYLFTGLEADRYTVVPIGITGPYEDLQGQFIDVDDCLSIDVVCSSSTLGEGSITVDHPDLNPLSVLQLDGTTTPRSGQGPHSWTGLLPGTYGFSASPAVPADLAQAQVEVPDCTITVVDTTSICASAGNADGRILVGLSSGPGVIWRDMTVNPGGFQGQIGSAIEVPAGEYTIEFDTHPSLDGITVMVEECHGVELVNLTQECPGDSRATVSFDIIASGGLTFSGVSLGSSDPQPSPGPYVFTNVSPISARSISLHDVMPADVSPLDLILPLIYADTCSYVEVDSLESTCASNGNGTVTVDVEAHNGATVTSVSLGGQTISAPGPYVFEGLDVGTYVAVVDGSESTESESIEVEACTIFEFTNLVVQCATDDDGSISFETGGIADISRIFLIGPRASAVYAPAPWEWTGLPSGDYGFNPTSDVEGIVIDPVTVPDCPGVHFDIEVICSSGADGRIELTASIVGGVEVESVLLELYGEGGVGVIDSLTADSSTGVFTFEDVAPGGYLIEQVTSTPTVDWTASDGDVSLIYVPSCSFNATTNSSSCNVVTVQVQALGDAEVYSIVMQPGDRPVSPGGFSILGNVAAGVYIFEVDSHPQLALNPVKVLDCPEISVDSLAVDCADGSTGEIRLDVSTSGPVVLTGLKLGFETIAAPGPYVWTGLTPGTKTITVESDADLVLDPIEVPRCPSILAGTPSSQCTDQGVSEISLFLSVQNGAEIESVTLLPDGKALPGDQGPYFDWTDVKPGIYTFEIDSKPEVVVGSVEVFDECPSLSLAPTWECSGTGQITVSANIETTGSQTVSSASLGFWAGLGLDVQLPNTIEAPGPYVWTDFEHVTPILYAIEVNGLPAEYEQSDGQLLPGACVVESVRTVTCAAPGIADGSVRVELPAASVAGSPEALISRVSLSGDSLPFDKVLTGSGPYVFDDIEAGAYVVDLTEGSLFAEARHELVVPQCAQAVAVTASCATGADGSITIVTTGGTNVKITVGLVSNLDFGIWPGLAAGTYVVNTSERIADLPGEIEVPQCPKSAPGPGSVSAVVTAVCDDDGAVLVEVETDAVAGAIVVGFVINGSFAAATTVASGSPIDVIVLTANTNDATSVSGPTVAPVCLQVVSVSVEPGGDQAIPVPPASGGTPTGVAFDPTQTVPLPTDFFEDVEVPTEVADEEPDEEPEPAAIAAPEPAPQAEVEPPAAPDQPQAQPAALPVPDTKASPPQTPLATVSTSIRRTGRSEITLPVECDVDSLEVEGVTNLLRSGYSPDGLPQFSTDGSLLDVGTHRFEVDCDGSLIAIDVFIYRQVGGARGEGNSVVRLAALSGLMLLVLTGTSALIGGKLASKD